MWKYRENRFDLKVIGYQFCDAPGDRFDDNWLIVRIKVQDEKNGNWEKEDPALLTFEVKELIDWFENLDLESNEEKDISFTEPNLEFLYMGKGHIQVLLDLEFLPPGLRAEWTYEKNLSAYSVDFLLNKNDIDWMVERLKSGIAQFHER